MWKNIQTKINSTLNAYNMMKNNHFQANVYKYRYDNYSYKIKLTCLVKSNKFKNQD